MVARVQVASNFRQLGKLNRFAKEYPQAVKIAAQNAAREITPGLLQDLAVAPPRPRRKIEWTTERQRRAYFATNGFGRGIPSRRTGGATLQWKVNFATSKDVVTMTVSNPNDYLRYVRVNPKRGRSQIQRFHKITGWREVSPIIETHKKEARQSFTRNLQIERERRLK